MHATINWHDVILAAEHLAGFVIVLLTLSLLWGLTALIGRLLGPRSAAAVTNAAAAAPAPAPAPVGAAAAAEPEAGLSDDEVVVVAATVAAMLDARHRIVSVRPVQSSWGQQGRRDIHASHRIR